MGRIIFLLQIIILISSFSTSFAATIRLTTGKIVEGDIIEKTDKYVKIDFQGVPLTYYVEDIESISYPTSDISQGITFSYAKKSLEYALDGKFGEAKKELEQSLKTNKNNLELQELLRTINDLNEEIVSEDYCSYLFRGIKDMEDKQYTQAIENLHQARQIKPDYPITYIYLGFASFFSGQNKEAKENFIKANNIFQNIGCFQGTQQIEKYLKQIE